MTSRSLAEISLLANNLSLRPASAVASTSCAFFKERCEVMFSSVALAEVSAVSARTGSISASNWSLRHSIAALDLQRLKLAGGLSADIDVLNWLQDARRHDGALDIATLDGCCRIDGFGLSECPVIGKRADTGQDECANQPYLMLQQEDPQC